jgi:hypothetical protein
MLTQVNTLTIELKKEFGSILIFHQPEKEGTIVRILYKNIFSCLLYLMLIICLKTCQCAEQTCIRVQTQDSQ